MEDLIQKTLAEILQNLQIPFRKFKVEEVETDRTINAKGITYRVDIDTDEAATLIGYHGETIYALQHLLKTLIWKKADENVFIILDVDSYRQRQEESVLTLAQRKVDEARKTMQDQRLPPMSPYFRRIVHLELAKEQYHDITTESTGASDHRAVVIRVKQ
ncbi:hypothetical protein COV82_04430 [Candidatus Peregrinibacteria bacterium CG11_big_fil_rev_8_21_14_0_20_46_8]|nr:MAG: hypothetical protein COV82_04430 [Candidatus Peregrinibacteria bacterium CG11_big_fil_rev_8_21_14_0_20_46_8]